MEHENAVVIKEDVMIPIYLSNGSFKTNEELLPVIQRTALALGLSTVNDLKAVTVCRPVFTLQFVRS